MKEEKEGDKGVHQNEATERLREAIGSKSLGSKKERKCRKTEERFTRK